MATDDSACSTAQNSIASSEQQQVPLSPVAPLMLSSELQDKIKDQLNGVMNETCVLPGTAEQQLGTAQAEVEMLRDQLGVLIKNAEVHSGVEEQLQKSLSESSRLRVELQTKNAMHDASNKLKADQRQVLENELANALKKLQGTPPARSEAKEEGLESKGLEKELSRLSKQYNMAVGSNERDELAVELAATLALADSRAVAAAGDVAVASVVAVDAHSHWTLANAPWQQRAEVNKYRYVPTAAVTC